MRGCVARVSKKAPTDRQAFEAAVDSLARVGLHEHQTVRFRRGAGGRWVEGTAVALEADGSLGLRDKRGRRRSIPIDDVEVASRGPRGGRIWVPLGDIAAATEQLGLF
jgi:hypothetical protein